MKLWSGNSASVTIPEMDDYNSIAVLFKCGDYNKECTFFRDSDITIMDASTFHSNTYNIYGFVEINWSTQYIHIQKNVGSWGANMLMLKEVYGKEMIINSSLQS